MFKEYLARQLSHRGAIYNRLKISKSTYYRHIKNPEQMTLGELRQLMLIGNLDEEIVMDWICRRGK